MDFACKITKNILQFSMLCPSSHNIIRVGPVACGPDQGKGCVAMPLWRCCPMGYRQVGTRRSAATQAAMLGARICIALQSTDCQRFAK